MYRYLIASDKGYNSARLGTNVARFFFYRIAVRLSCRSACKLSCKTFSRAIINQFSGQVKLFVALEVLCLENI